MKRFLVFTGLHHSKEVGWDSFVGAFNSLEEAKAAELKSSFKNGFPWSQIIDLETEKEVK